MRLIRSFALVVLCLGATASTALAQIRLIGMTGELNSPEFDFSAGPNDETLYEINLTNAATTRLFQATRIPDTNTIGYNPLNGLIYHLSGSESYRNDPTRWGYRDNQYMETIHPTTFASAAVFNSNGPPAPDSAPIFGLPGPRPTWLLPAARRTDQEIDGSFRQRGEDEYAAARELAWSASQKLFYLTADNGIFTMTPTGDSQFVGLPGVEGGDIKGIEFVNVGGQSKLYISSKNSANLYEIDPATGVEIGNPIEVKAPAAPGSPPEPTGKILALAAHPTTNVLYGILQPVGADEVSRQLATIDLTSGVATVIGLLNNAGDAALASFAFVGFTTPSFTADFDADNDVDGADLTRWKTGFGTTGNATRAQGDADGDMDVDGSDFLAWQRQLGSAGAASNAGAVPEPGSVLMILLAALGIRPLCARRVV